jgi:cob(I)alamin adenosyltransferase
MKIYTKTGDQGKTSLLSGKRVPKYHDRINAYGTVDELNSYLGLLRDQEINKDRKNLIIKIQTNLFTIGSSLASDPEKPFEGLPELTEADILELEKEMDNMDEKLPEMRNFVLPGGHSSVSYCHIARCVCRRAERLVNQLQQQEEVSVLISIYLNRLSDYLFVLARMNSQELGVEEIPWKPRA